MFADYIYEQAAARFSNRVMLLDADDLERETGYSRRFTERGFQVLRYQDDLHMRLEHEEVICGEAGKAALIVGRDSYVPYDILQRFRRCTVSLTSLFPRLNAAAVRNAPQMNYDLLTLAYNDSFADLRSQQKTEQFIQNTVYSSGNAGRYLHSKNEELHRAVSAANTWQDWCRAADLKALIDSTAARFEIEAVTDDVHERFAEYILTGFSKLSAVLDRDGPVLVSRAMEYMRDHSSKFAVVVMDGMSQFDWQIISQSFADIRYEKTDVFAMIPTTTSVSRQCLLSNQYPNQLLEPWKQHKEKHEFTECAKRLGFAPKQIGYKRGYDADFGAFVRCAAVIINEVDDMVHAQMQGRLGMLQGISLAAKRGRLAELTKRLLKKGFDVYIASDHGNTPCIGTGKRVRTGVEVETRSRRMLVLKDFADKQALIAQHGLIDYPKYFLNKDLDCLICGAGRSFDAPGAAVMSHGGITLDEVIVPFIKIKAVENNG